ncbi:MAG: sterol desaturase family protein [Chthoniobacteraceae bacterium]
MTPIIGLGIAFVIMAAVFTLLAVLFPGQKGQRFFRTGFRIDLFYWFFTPLVTKAVSRIAMIAVALPLVLAMGLSWEQLKQSGYHGFGPVSRQPFWLQGVEIFLLGDLLGYWMHRLFHGRKLWSFHAVHHCSTEIDWLSSVRLHPFNEAFTRMVEVIPLFVAGFNPKALAAYVPLVTVHAIFLHANVNWSFGTFYLPAGKNPENFGVNDPVPESLWGQLIYPFQHRQP